MSMIRFADVSFAYPNQSALIDQCDLHLSAGWTGFVGRNGQGKSTLLSLISGDLQPTKGRIHRSDGRVVVCAQSLDKTAQVDAIATEWTRNALRWLALLDLDPDDYWRWHELSPGTRRKWQIASVLYDDADVVLLDEPANHLDVEGREALKRAMASFKGIGVVVSHDRELLDATCDETVRIESGAVTSYPGAYSTARASWRANEARDRAELERLQARRDGVRRELGALRNEHASAQHAQSSRTRMTSVRDTDARSLGRKARANKAEAKIGRNSGVSQRALERVENELATLQYRPRKDPGAVVLDGALAPNSWVIRTRLDTLCVEDRLLLSDCDIHVERDARLWLRGPNGCGKTTLLKRLLHELEPRVRARTLWIPQDVDEIVPTVQRLLMDSDRSTREHIFNLAAALDLEVDRLVDVARGIDVALSPGQWRKAVTAVGLTARPWLVILDEPTNDLDIPSIERFEAALAPYSGALMVVTHDRYFAEAVQLSPLDVPWQQGSDVTDI